MTAARGSRGSSRGWVARSAGVGMLLLALVVPTQAALAAPVNPAAATDPSVLLFVRDTASASSLMTLTVDGVTGSPTGTATPLETSSTLAYSDLAISPDGAKVAYVVDDSSTGATSVRVRATDGSGSDATIASTASAFPGSVDSGCVADATACPVAQPAWSPDGTTVMFTRYGSDTGTDYRSADLFRVAVAGGDVTAVPGGALASHGSYIADGSGIVAADEDPDAPVRLLKISTGGTRSALTGGSGANAPSVSPDGRWIAAVRQKDVLTDAIVVLPIAGGTAVTVSDAVADPNAISLDGSPTWTADSVRVYFDRQLTDATSTRVTVRSAVRDGSAPVGLAPAAGADEGWPAFSGGDRTAPVARMLGPNSVALLTPSISVSWSASDPGLSGVASYDVRYRRTSGNGAVSAYTNWRTATTATSAVATLSTGFTYCWSVRATDAKGNVGAWSSELCSAVPFDERQLSKSSGWTAASSSVYYRNTVLTTLTSKRTLATPSLKYRQVGFVVRTCSSCGTFTVYLGSRKLSTVNTRSTSATTKYIRWLPLSSSTSSGVVKIVTNGVGRVYLDGVVVRH